MRYIAKQAIVALAAAAAAAGTALAQELKPFSTFSNKIIYAPPQGSRTSYARHVELQDGTLLVTSSVFGGNFFGPGPDGVLSSFPVFESKDGGVSWTWISNITDQVNGWGMGAHPALAEMTRPLGGYPAGTVLASGNSVSNTGTRLDIYASVDKARSWKFVSRCAEGGRPNTTNGADPVWEPYLLEYGDEIVCYYSDQRDPKHGQMLAHQVSKDLKTWGPVVKDVAYAEYLARPGMTVVAYIEPIKKWILVHEFPVGNSSSHGVNYPVYYRLASSPLEFDAAEGIPIVINGTLAPNASPYVVWSPIGGPNGTIVVSDADSSAVYTNRAGGDRDKWEAHGTPQPSAYSRALHIFNKYPDHLMILGGSVFDDGGDPNLTLSVVSLTDVLADKFGPPEKVAA